MHVSHPSALAHRGLRVVGLSLALASLLPGCPVSPPEPPEPSLPDDGRVLIERDPACTLTGDLRLTLGEGDGTDDFRPLEPGKGPYVHHGSQGGIHVILGVSVANPATGFPGMQVRFILESEVCERGTCQPFAAVGRYVTVVRENRYIPQEGGAIALSGFLVILDYWPQETRRRITAEAIDRCGRRGTTTVELAPGTP